MVIYGEYLFLENALTGGLILLLTRKITGCRFCRGQLLFGSILCGLYSFVLFLDQLGIPAAVLLKLGFSAGLMWLVFRPKQRRNLFRCILVFYLVSFAMGGITIGMMYFLGIMGVTQNTSIYLGGLGYLYLLPGCMITWFLFSFLAEFIKGKLFRERTCADVEIELEGKCSMMRGLVDTGNFLVDPFTGKPVMVISEVAAKQLLADNIVEAAVAGGQHQMIPELLQNSHYAGRLRMIPYHCIGQKRSSLIGIRTDAVRICITEGADCGKNVTVSEGVVLAICRGMLDGAAVDGGCSILLHPSMIEGGIACDA